jgi:hypothetical protein
MNTGKIDRTVNKALDMVEKLEKLFGNNGAFENAVLNIGGDISYFGDVRRTLTKLYGELEDLHYGALGHMDESVTESVKLTEGVLDGDDEDGFMARSQLYFLAKDAISLHGMISDRDNLEPWVQSKITTAANDIEAVRRYTEYNQQQADRQLPVPVEEPDMEMEEGWESMPAVDAERYGPRDGLEGPFQTRVGKVVYYDPKAGKYYDPDSDHYLEYDEWRQLDKPGTPLRNEVAEAADRYVDILGDDLPNGIDYNFKNLPKVKWSQYSRQEIAKFVDHLENLEFDDYDGTYGSMYRNAINWVEKNVLAKKKVAEAAERPYVCVHAKKGKHSCTAGSSYEAAKKAAAHWKLKSTAGIDAHLADVKHTATESVSEGKGKPDLLDLDKDGNKKEPMKKAAKDAKKVEEGMDFDDKRNDDLKQIASDMFSHAKKAAARKVK